MIQFNFTGNPYPSFEEKEEAKKRFIEKLGPLKDEFEQKGGIVTFDYSYPPEDTRRMSFVISNQYNLSDFIIRWNEYIRTLQK